MMKYFLISFITLFTTLALHSTPDETFSHRGYQYEITFSKYNDEHKSERDAAFNEWIDRQASQREFDRMSKEGKYPIITEVTSQHYKRRIFAKKKGSVAVRTGRNYSQFVEYHKEYFSKGYQLLSLTYFIDQFGKKWYNATWVDHKDYDSFAEDLDSYGITRAKVEIFEK